MLLWSFQTTKDTYLQRRTLSGNRRFGGRKIKQGKQFEDDRLGYYFRSWGLERPVSGGGNI